MTSNLFHETFELDQWGYSYRSDNFEIYFLNSEFNQEKVIDKFKNYYFFFLKQVHDNTCIEAPHKDSPEADAHYTQQKNAALCINTADCLPVMITDGQTALAIHAGWRGLVKKVIQLSIDKSPVALSKAQVFIGPHIKLNSFEVGDDVADKLLNCQEVYSAIDLFASHPDPNKKYVNLTKIAEAQLKSAGIDPALISICEDNTFEDDQWNSFRRDREKSGRNISFCVLI